MPITIPGYKNYFGGKSGSGTKEVLINHMPPHDVRFVCFAGLDALTRYSKPARLNVINDRDSRITDGWLIAVGNDPRFKVITMDALDLLMQIIDENFDTAETFIYIDPPYLFSTRKGQRPVYRYEMTVEQHRELLYLVKTLKHAKVMISHYPNEMYDEELVGWETVDYESTTRQGQARERLYMNYTITDQLHDYSCIGTDFRDRERITRIKKNFIKKFNRLEPQLKKAVMQDLAPQFYAMGDQVASTAEKCDETRCTAATAFKCDMIKQPFAGHIAKNCDGISKI